MSFLNHFSELPDPRSDINCKYELLDVVFLTVTVILSGAEGWSDIEEFGKTKLTWLRKFRAFENGIPVDDTIARLIRAIEPVTITECFISWVNEMRRHKGHEFFGIDGKTLRHSFEAQPKNALNSLTVWLREIEVRRYTQLPISEQLLKASSWKDARSIVRVERERHIGEKQTSETIYYITSHQPHARFIADAIRSHWQVENKVHWVLDVVYREDDCRIRRGNGAENIAIFRRLCMNPARLHPKKDSMRGKLKSAGWNDDFREELLFGIKG